MLVDPDQQVVAAALSKLDAAGFKKAMIGTSFVLRSKDKADTKNYMSFDGYLTWAEAPVKLHTTIADGYLRMTPFYDKDQFIGLYGHKELATRSASERFKSYGLAGQSAEVTRLFMKYAPSESATDAGLVSMHMVNPTHQISNTLHFEDLIKSYTTESWFYIKITNPNQFLSDLIYEESVVPSTTTNLTGDDPAVAEPAPNATPTDEPTGAGSGDKQEKEWSWTAALMCLLWAVIIVIAVIVGMQRRRVRVNPYQVPSV